MSHPGEAAISRLLEALDPAGFSTLEHLLECRLCRLQLRPTLHERWVKEVAVGSWEANYDAVWERLEEHLRRTAEAHRQEEAEGADRIAELFTLPEEERRRAIRAGGRYRSWTLASQLLEAGRVTGKGEPAAGLEAIHLALAIAETLDGEREGFEARAHCYLGEILFLSGNLAGAEAAFQHAALHLEGSADPLDRAWFCHLLGRMRAETGRRDEAAALAGRAALLFAWVGQGIEATVAILDEIRLLIELAEPDLAQEPLYRLVRLSHLDLLPPDLFAAPAASAPDLPAPASASQLLARIFQLLGDCDLEGE